MSTVVRNALPPGAVLAVLNPVMRACLSSWPGRYVGRFALLEFRGRRTGTLLRVPVGWHLAEGCPVVVTPASWRVNFAEPRRVAVYHDGRSEWRVGTLANDPAVTASVLQGMVDCGAAPRDLGLRIPPRHRITAADVVAVDRALIWLQPAGDDRKHC